MTRCPKCDRIKPEDDFHWANKRTGKKQCYCKQCVSEYNALPENVEKRKRMYSERPASVRSKWARTAQLLKYGLTISDYEKMHKLQGGRCANLACGNSAEILCVDHCHKTGKVRGLLCNGCNVALGQVGDSINRLDGAIRYLGGNVFEPSISTALL